MATPRTPAAQIGRIPVVLAAAALGELVPAWRTIALTLTELGAAAFFISGTVTSAIGGSAPWFVLAAVVAGAVLRAADVESWALFMPGGLPGRVNEAFGRRPARFAAAAVLVERLFFAALVACVAGHYTVSVLISGLGLSRLAEHVASSDLAAAAGASIIGILWIRSRVGRRVGASLFERWVWVPLAALLVTAIWGQIVAVAAGHVLPPAPSWSGEAPFGIQGLPEPLLVVLAALVGFGVALPAMAGGDSLARRAAELPQPRLPGLRRTARLATIFGLVVIAGATFAIATLMPPEAQIQWDEVPLVGLIALPPGTIFLKLVLTMLLAASGVAMLSHAADASLDDATTTLQRLSRVGVIPESISRHPSAVRHQHASHRCRLGDDDSAADGRWRPRLVALARVRRRAGLHLHRQDPHAPPAARARADDAAPQGWAGHGARPARIGAAAGRDSRARSRRS